MSIHSILSDLVVIADSLHDKNRSDIVADVDAAIFTLSSEDAYPSNKSLNSIARENYLLLREETSEAVLETVAVSSAVLIAELIQEVLKMEPVKRACLLRSVAQSIQATVGKGHVPTGLRREEGIAYIAEAENKIAEHTELKAIGYRLGLIRAKLEDNG